MKIKSIKKSGEHHTWDINVPDGNEFLMQNGCVSHNTSSILGVNECFEPFGANIQVRNTGSGEFLLINKYLVQDLEKLGIWNDYTKQQIIQNEGSVQSLPLPDHIREKYKSVWEISQRDIIEMAADRQKYIDQSQSMNLYFEGGTYGKISGALRYGWEQGLKTGVYYTKTEKKTEKPKRLTQMDNTQTKSEGGDYECFGCSA
jgi:ribonucleoside-diphosphate reductase alpha chain